MTYHAGLLLATIGGPNRYPHLTCDGCGTKYNIPTNKPAPKWLLDNKAPRGWRHETTADPATQAQTTKHYCPRCR